MSCLCEEGAQRHCDSPSPAASFLWGKSVSLSLLELLLWVFWGAAVGRAPSIPAGIGVSRSGVYGATCLSSLCPRQWHRANPSQVKLAKQTNVELFISIVVEVLRSQAGFRIHCSHLQPCCAGGGTRCLPLLSLATKGTARGPLLKPPP